MENRCVQCGFQVKTLFVQNSPGNIRLMKCENCKAVADEYIECELMMLVDVILGNFMFLCSFLLAIRNLLKISA